MLIAIVMVFWSFAIIKGIFEISFWYATYEKELSLGYKVLMHSIMSEIIDILIGVYLLFNQFKYWCRCVTIHLFCNLVFYSTQFSAYLL